MVIRLNVMKLIETGKRTSVGDTSTSRSPQEMEKSAKGVGESTAGPEGP